jgi:hypothetical protein
MMIVVRPLRSRRRACCTRRSVGHVQVRGGLVEDEQGRAGQPGAGEGDQLALAGRQEGAALADLGVEALREGTDHRLGPDRPGGRLDLVSCSLGAAEADVVGHRSPFTAKA